MSGLGFKLGARKNIHGIIESIPVSHCTMCTPTVMHLLSLIYYRNRRPRPQQWHNPPQHQPATNLLEVNNCTHNNDIWPTCIYIIIQVMLVARNTLSAFYILHFLLVLHFYICVYIQIPLSLYQHWLKHWKVWSSGTHLARDLDYPATDWTSYNVITMVIIEGVSPCLQQLDHRCCLLLQVLRIRKRRCASSGWRQI